MENSVVIANYGVGNLHSIQNMLRKIHVPSIIASRPEELKDASRIILPGVGSFDTCMSKLKSSGLCDALEEMVLRKRTPVLGICVGMQLMLNASEEGTQAGLGWINGKVVKFDASKLSVEHKVPHMGWSDVHLEKASSLLNPMHENSRFYFVHSYHATVENSNNVLLSAEYGYRFVAAVEQDNIRGVQFHPEKSHKFGMQLLKNFANLA
jgi:glutamine amidotransferase